MTMLIDLLNIFDPKIEEKKILKNARDNELNGEKSEL